MNKTDAELRAFIEGWIPINAKDAQHVKQAKLEAREEFVQLIKARDAAIRIDELEQSFANLLPETQYPQPWAGDSMQVSADAAHTYKNNRIEVLRRESESKRD